MSRLEGGGFSPAEARFYRDWGQWVARERKRVGLTQPDLGGLVRLGRGTIACIETGQQRVFLHHARAIEKVFADRHVEGGSVFDRAGAPEWPGG